MPAEVELKLGIAPGAAGRLLRHPALAAARAGRGTRTRLVATYFDTPDGLLAEEGIGLRLRHERGAWLQTVKGPPLPASSGALVARDEHEFPLAGPELDRQALTRTPWSRPLQRALADPAFGPRFVTDFLRRTVPLRFADASTALLCIDCGELRDPDGEQRRSIAEIEIEQLAGAPLELFRFAALLAADLPLRILMAGKAERGHALLRGDPDGWRQPVRAAAPVLTADGDAASALAAIVRECAGQIAGNAAGLVHDDDPEWVHQMRVGTRRLRACLGLLQPLLPAPGVAAVAADLRWLAALLGGARDLDVYVDERWHRWSAPPARTRRSRTRCCRCSRRSRTPAPTPVPRRGPPSIRRVSPAWCWPWGRWARCRASAFRNPRPATTRWGSRRRRSPRSCSTAATGASGAAALRWPADPLPNATRCASRPRRCATAPSSSPRPSRTASRRAASARASPGCRTCWDSSTTASRRSA
ncbi:MAG: inorganic triphosphatase [Betaproteobacteria bacterium]|nr:inorganic triphosphatase [Betaproteobacteria bacterium]